MGYYDWGNFNGIWEEFFSLEEEPEDPEGGDPEAGMSIGGGIVGGEGLPGDEEDDDGNPYDEIEGF